MQAAVRKLQAAKALSAPVVVGPPLLTVKCLDGSVQVGDRVGDVPPVWLCASRAFACAHVCSLVWRGL
jgi:hypothetical protein